MLVINRYDWSSYDKRGLLEGEEPAAGIGIADYAATGNGRTSAEWTGSGDGVMLECGGEYEFGRFSFDVAGERAGRVRSFLYFRATTGFTQTRCGELPREPLLELLTDGERHARRLARGFDFSGFGEFRKIIDMHTMAPAPMLPPRWAGRLLGPFATEARVFEDADLEALRASVGGKEICAATELFPAVFSAPARPFEPSLAELVCALMDELAMSWLAGPALAALDGAATGRKDVAARMFPRHATQPSLDRMAHTALLEADDSPRDGQHRALCGRLGSFLEQRGAQLGGASGVAACHVHAALLCVLAELLELATNSARDNRRPCICPADVRLPVAMHDPELEAMFGFSRALWVPME